MNDHKAPVFWVSFAMITGFTGTALISPLYALYQSAWRLQVSEVTYLYVIYMVGALVAFATLGGLADKVSSRKLILIALATSFGGTLISALAPDLHPLAFGRFLVGVASSLVTSAGSVALMEHMPPRGRPYLPLTMTLLLTLGFGIGPLVGGIFGQWVSNPLFTAYLPPILALAISAIGIAVKLPAPSSRSPASQLTYRDLLPRLTAPASDQRLMFAVTCGFPFLAFGVFGIYASLSPLFIERIMGWTGPIASGLSIAIILLLSGMFQIITRRLKVTVSAPLGLFILGLSSITLMVNFSAGSAALYVTSVLLTAVGHSLAMMTGMRLLHSIAAPGRRAGLTSTYLVVGYAGAIFPLLAVGWIADHWGLSRGITFFCCGSILLSFALICTFRRASRGQPSL